MIAELGLAWALAQTAGPSGPLSPTEVQRRFQEERFTASGFPPIQPEATTFRRLILSDPYMMLPMPGLEIRRRADGQTELVLQYPEWRSDPIPVEAELWEAVASEDLFRVPETPAPPPPGPPTPPPPICHAWSGLIQDEAGRMTLWNGCSGSIGAPGDASVRLVTAALASRPDCEQDAGSPFFAFQRCFGLNSQLDDPVLEAAFAPLRQAWDGVPGMQVLGDARTALRAPDMRRGDPAWTTAREAVEAVKRTQDQRRNLVARAAQLQHRSYAASSADLYRLSRTVRGWNDFTESQDRNYIHLLEQLLAVEP